MYMGTYSGAERRAQPRSGDDLTATDAELAWRLLRRQDYRALKSLMGRHADALRRFLMRLSGDRHIAEDLMQQTWLTLLESLPSQPYRPTGGAVFRTYLFTLARNRYLDEYTRKHVVSRTHYVADPLPEGMLPDDYVVPAAEKLAQQEQWQRLLHSALARLPCAQREVVTMWAAGWEIDAIAAHMQAPRETILSRRKYALRKLRAALSAFT
jgi:RNA polymerase sigma-70 factor (ECF subfamily)